MVARRISIVTGCLLIVTSVLRITIAAQDARFSASADRTTVGVGEQFQITFELSGSSGGRNFRPPALEDFLVLSGPNQSTNMQFVNGVVSSSVTYSYILQPRSVGTFSIGPASIEYNGTQLTTQPLKIQVTQGQPRAAQQGQQATPSQGVDQEIGDNLFLKLELDKTRVYQGEQITATYKIYTRVNVANYSLSKLPALTGFWSEDLEVPKQIQLSMETVNGKQYRVGVLKKVALFPQQSGSLTIDPMEVECVVQLQQRRRTGDLFDQFFNDPFFGGVRNVNYKVRSETGKVTVQSLPQENVPDGFSGAVGRFAMETWLDKRQTKANEAVTLKVKFTGRGNLRLLEAPRLNIPADIDHYDPKLSDNITREGGRVGGTRTFEYLLIPRYAGDRKIPSFAFSYFDPEKRSYVTHRSPELALSVEQAAATAAGTVSGTTREDVRLLGEDIRFIKSGDVTLRRKGSTFAGSTLFVAVSMTPLVLIAGLIVYTRRREKVLGNGAVLRQRRARKVAKQRLVSAKKFLDQKKREEFFTEVSHALWGYTADTLGLPASDLSRENIRESLAQRSVPTDVIDQLSQTIDECEYARFAPATDSLEMERVYERAVTLISSIEDQAR
jgi:hypothetical protein